LFIPTGEVDLQMPFNTVRRPIGPSVNGPAGRIAI